MIFLDGDICKGCSFDNDDWYNQCRMRNQEMQNECPCTKCLVTCMCTQTCPPYDRAFKIAFNQIYIKRT